MRLVLVITLLCACACTDADATRETAESMGFTNVQIGGYAFFQCSDDDKFQTEFQATNPQGRRVNGVVCCGLLKGCTLRLTRP